MNALADFIIDPSGDARRAMDRMYRLQRHIYDATRKYYLLGRDQLIRDLACPPGGSILEIGCGTARNLSLAGKFYPDARLFGCDISDEMLKSAGKAIIAGGLEKRTRLAQADAVTFDPHTSFGVESFDRIYFSYTLSMIPDWSKALAHAASFLRHGGELHVVDFGSCGGLPPVLKTGLRRWLALFDVEPRDNLGPVSRAVASQNGLTAAFRNSHRGYAVHVCLRRAA